ncbi:hypothetical protein G6L28_06800 [Agrobacterium larrymoorei]|uniref:hypothetical protein n=1 Tax=Agrobacterium larrymoorei TaxID=160699 RepID=UPI001573D345|nr:hypothetical protein [Agrobacterium larrymoorei]NTJ42308.1 hypothetical protein [Agrobacterium larrymoorei]
MSDPATDADGTASRDGPDMKRKRFVDMEAFSRSIMLRAYGFFSEDALPAGTSWHVDKVFEFESAGSHPRNKTAERYCQIFANKNRAAPECRRGFETLKTQGKLKAAGTQNQSGATATVLARHSYRIVSGDN